MGSINDGPAYHSRIILGGLILGLALLVLAAPARAHRLLVFAFAEGSTIHTESKFVGSGPVQKGTVQVQDRQSGQVLLTGATDEKGKFSFAVPAVAADQRLDLLIVVEAGMGHQGEWLLKADKYLPGGQALGAPSPAPSPAPAASGRAGSAAAAAPVTGAGFDQQALEAALDKALERQLAPLKEMLTELSVRRTTFADIMGGLGYIAGIFGVAAYFMSKKKPNP